MQYGDERDDYRAADDAKAMADTPGWVSLARWMTEQVSLDLDAVERGVGSWDEYQRAVGRLAAYRRVLGRPEELVKYAEELKRGDNQ